MQNIVQRITSEYFQTPNAILEDDRLTSVSIHIYLYLRYRASIDGWKFYNTDLIKHTRCTKKTFSKHVDILIQTGWIERVRMRKDGKLAGYSYTINNEGKGNISTSNGSLGSKKGTVEKLLPSRNYPLNKKDLINKDLNSNNIDSVLSLNENNKLFRWLEFGIISDGENWIKEGTESFPETLQLFCDDYKNRGGIFTQPRSKNAADKKKWAGKFQKWFVGEEYTVDTARKDRPGSVNEVIEYFIEKGMGAVSAKKLGNKFWNYYESNGWKVGKNKMVKWKGAAGNAVNWDKKGSTEAKPQYLQGLKEYE